MMILIFVTCVSEAEAENIAKLVIDKNLAACAHIMPPHKSIYRWQGKVEQAAECNLLIKTQSHHFDAVRDTVIQSHSYEVPAIFAMPVTHIHEPYADWLRAQTG